MLAVSRTMTTAADAAGGAEGSSAVVSRLRVPVLARLAVEVSVAKVVSVHARRETATAEATGAEGMAAVVVVVVVARCRQDVVIMEFNMNGEQPLHIPW